MSHTRVCRKGAKWLFILVTVGIFVSIFMSSGILRAGERNIVERADGGVCLSWLGSHLIRVKRETYRVQRWGANRLKLKGITNHHGVFLKRLGIHLVIRDLSGNILHIVQKGGVGYLVQTPVGQNLFFIDPEARKVRVLKQGGSCLFVVLPDRKGEVIRDAKGRPLYTVKARVGGLAASFLCIPALSWPERAGCFLLFAAKSSP